MVEYAVIASRNFGESFHNIWLDVSNFLNDIPPYWYIVAVIAFFLLVKVLAGRKV